MIPADIQTNAAGIGEDKRQGMAHKLIISGPPRSGTTVLAEMIARHHKVALTIEHDFAQIAGNLLAAFDKEQEHRTFLASMTQPVDADQFSPDREQNAQDISYADLSILRDAGFTDAPPPENLAPKTIDQRFERLLDTYFSDATGKTDPIWIGDKMPDVFAKTRLAGMMDNVCDIHFIYIFRHPLAMIASSMRRRSDTLAGQDNWYLHGLGEDIAVWLRNWQACQDLMAAGHRVHVVKYEDLVERTNTTISEVFAFLGLEPLPLQCRLYDTPQSLQARYISERDRDYVNDLMGEIIARWDDPINDTIRTPFTLTYLASRGAHLTMVDLDPIQVKALYFGFYPPDAWCRWTTGRAGIRVRLFERERPTHLLIDFAAYNAPDRQGLLDLAINGQTVLQIDPISCEAERDGCRLALPLPATGQEVTLTLNNPRFKPADAPYSTDPRELGVAIRSLTFE